MSERHNYFMAIMAYLLCYSSRSSKVSSQALLYVGAIDLSIKAAQYGFSASEDILNIFAQIEQGASEKAISEFLKNILLQAQKAHKVVDETLGRFRAVRQSFHEVSIFPGVSTSPTLIAESKNRLSKSAKTTATAVHIAQVCGSSLPFHAFLTRFLQNSCNG